MKRLIVGLIFLVITLTGFSQSRWDGFFRPVTRSTPAFRSAVERSGNTSSARGTVDQSLTIKGPVSLWLFRPVVTLSALQFNFEKPTTVTSLSSLGTGLSYSHFTEVEGQPYCNYAFNLLALFGTDITDVSPVELSLAATVSAFQYINVGAGFNISNKNFFILTGVNFNFNK